VARTRTHIDYNDPGYSELLPFQPSDQPLKDALRRNFMVPAAIWLLGRDETDVLAMEGGSAWETALTVRYLLDLHDILGELSEEPDLRRQIDTKAVAATRWLLTKRVQHPGNSYCWEHVTWDTSVIVESLLGVLQRYRSRFSPDEQDEIETTIIGSTAWLYGQFAQWESRVKYPFGPADVAQIANTVLALQVTFPELHKKVVASLKADLQYDLPLHVIQYLLRRRTFRQFTMNDDNGTVEASGCWWDDFFSSAEVIEALARFYRAGLQQPEDSEWREVLTEVRRCLLEACAFLENTQLDGMWGNHIDTIRLLSAYTMTRRLVPQHAQGRDEPILLPEVHIAFKALRWACDDKQIFDDGSFLHALFLTVFYANALVEVYRSWEPVKYPVEKVYDDVVWASPVRTTPERTRRLAADLRNESLQSEIDRLKDRLSAKANEARRYSRAQRRLVVGGLVVALTILGSIYIASAGEMIAITVDIKNQSDLLAYLALVGSLLAVIVAIIWKYGSFGRGHDQE
jgi:hypothetical protein